MNTIEKTDRYHFPTYKRFKVSFVKGEGVYLFDEEGKRYVDFLAGIAVCCLGHSHPRIKEAIADQAGKLMHISNLFYNPVQADLVEKLSLISFKGRVFLCNSGAEANEGAIKLARKYHSERGSQRWKILTFEKSFHGRTLATISATGQEKVKKGFYPMVDGFIHVPFGDLDAVEWVLEKDGAIAAILVEPLQGEGGINVPPHGFLEGLRELSNRFGVLLMLDEVQTGMGRTGKFFAYQHFGVEPDVMTLAKGLGGGFPIGAVLAKDQVAEVMGPGSHASTFGGNPLACRVALEVIKIIEEEDLLGRVKEMGDYTLGAFSKLRENYPKDILDVRGKGLLVGVEFSFDAGELVEYLLSSRMVTNAIGNVLRLTPPFYIEKDHIDILVEEVEGFLKERRFGKAP